MRTASAFAVITLLILTSCGPVAKTRPELPRNSTGFFKETEAGPVDYIQNDPYVQKRLNEAASTQQPAPPEDDSSAAPAPVSPAAPATPPQAKAPKTKTSTPASPVERLKTRVKGFEIARFGKEDLKKATRFGDAEFAFTVFFHKAEHQVLKGSLKAVGGNRFDLNQAGKRYTVRGVLTDADEKTTGVLYLTDSQTKETIEISYRAFKAGLTVRRNINDNPTAGSSLERQLHALCADTVDVVNRCKSTFGWVNNWTVLDGSLGGPAFYCVDILKIVTPEEAKKISLERPAFAFCGESLRTGGETDVFEHKAESMTPETASDITMVGNGEEGARMFEATLIDKETKEKNELLIDVDAEDTPQETQSLDFVPEEVGTILDEDSGGEDTTVGPQTEEPSQEPQFVPEDVIDLNTPSTPPTSGEKAPKATPKPNEKPAQPQTPTPVAKPSPPVVSGDAYMATDMSKARSARMVKDFNRNRDLPGVREMIRKYQIQHEDVPNIRNYFVYANPFRKMIKAIARTFDVSPAFGYLTIVESGYFTHGTYTLKAGDSGRAIGAYQMHPPAASETGLPSAHRAYFAPASCGAARYMASLVNLFWKGDTTVAILAYNQGGGGAQKLMNRSIKYGGSYAYTYSAMLKFGRMTEANKRYVNKFLAAYFIASNLSHYKFDPSIPGARTSMPSNGTVYPGGSVDGIRDSACRAAVGSI